MSKRFWGVIPPVITPLDLAGNLDVEGLERLLEHMIAGGVNGLFVLGSTGEGPAVGLECQRQMILESCRIARHRLPVLVGVSGDALAGAVELAKVAAEANADAVVSAPPCYFNCGMPEVVDYFNTLCRHATLPVLVYNMPAMTKVNITPETVIKLAQNPQIAGYKDSSGNMVELHAVLQALSARPDFSIFVGPEELLAEAVIFGADGGIPGGANLNPALYVAMYRAAAAGDLPRVRKLQTLVYLQRKLYQQGRYQSSMIKGVKSALSLSGICRDVMSQPFHHFEAAEQRRIAEICRELDAALVAAGLPGLPGNLRESCRA